MKFPVFSEKLLRRPAIRASPVEEDGLVFTCQAILNVRLSNELLHATGWIAKEIAFETLCRGALVDDSSFESRGVNREPLRITGKKGFFELAAGKDHTFDNPDRQAERFQLPSEFLGEWFFPATGGLDPREVEQRQERELEIVEFEHCETMPYATPSQFFW